MKSKVVVLGAGGWGLALALNAHKYGNDVTVWSPFSKELEDIRKFGENKKLLPGVPVPPSLLLTDDISCVSFADLIIIAVPSFAIKETAEKAKKYVKQGTVVANAGKGLERETHKRFSVILEEILPQAKIGVLSGPSHAEEVSRGVPTTIIAASKDIEAAEKMQKIIMNPKMRVYVNDDIIGVELGGALKNIVALSAGICDGLAMGDNTKAALMTRGLAEITRLGVELGARKETFAGLSGMGDLIVTCGSLHSRNRRAGMLIGQGHTPEEAVKIVGTVEGYHAARAAHELSFEHGIDMPISENCYRICYENQDPRESLIMLMQRPPKHESEE